MRQCIIVALVSTSTIGHVIGYQLGIEAFGKSLDMYKNKRIGLVTNQTGITQSGARTIDVLRNKGFTLTTILVPEHGLNGTTPAAQPIPDTIDDATHLPVIGLYAGGDAPHRIAPQTLDTLDAIFFDLQDCGMRHYTYISTLYTLLETCAQNHIPLVVFDRPNPLGFVMEGPLVDEGRRTFISIAPIPVRHAMTIGELAHYFNNQLLTQPAPLTVVPLKHYRRTQQLNHLDTFLSPNIKTIDACRGYSFLGLLGEVQPFNYNTCVETPFQCIMLRSDQHMRTRRWRSLQLILERNGVASSRITDHNSDTFTGLLITIPHVNHYSAFNTLLEVLTFVRNEKIPLIFKPAFDTAMGTDMVRRYIQGELSLHELATTINRALQQFYERAQPSWLYKPYPHIIPVKE